METMHAAGRRNLPPVPRPTAESVAERTLQLRRTDEPVVGEPTTAVADDDTAVFPPTVDVDTADGEAPALDDQAGAEVPAVGDQGGTDVPPDDGALPDEALPLDAELPDAHVLALADEPELALDDDDPAQSFVSRLRAAADAFAAAAGAQSAVVREAVPPARHRRSRCRVVLRYVDGAEADLTFLGSIGRPGTPAWVDFDQQIQQWLGDGQHRASEWLVEDQEASDGMAVDVPAWLAAG